MTYLIEALGEREQLEREIRDIREIDGGLVFDRLRGSVVKLTDSPPHWIEGGVQIEVRPQELRQSH